MPLTCRFAQEEDAEGIRQLWRDESGWGELPGTIQQWFRSNPCEGSMVVVAVDEGGRVAGEFVFRAHRVMVGGRSYRAIRPNAPIVGKEWRSFRSGDPMDHPLMAMYRFGVDAAIERGDGLLYMMPDPRWVRFVQMFQTLKYTKFPLLKMGLPLGSPLALPEGFTSGPLPAWDERVDRLWQQHARLYECLTVRDARTMAWKSSGGKTTTTAVYRAGELAGVAVVIDSDGQLVIGDLISADREDALRATLLAACNEADAVFRNPEREQGLRKVTVMSPPILHSLVESVGFERDQYDFLVVTRPLNPEIEAEAIAPERWYLSVND